MGLRDLRDRADKALEDFEDKTGVDVKPDKGQDGKDSTDSKPENNTDSEPETEETTDNKDSDQKQDTNPAVDRLRSSLGIGDSDSGGSSGGSSSGGDSTDEIRKNTDVKDAKDADILKQNPEDGNIIESPGERTLSKAFNRQGGLGSKELNQSIRADQFVKSKENLQEAQETERQIDSQIQEITGDNADRYTLQGQDKVLTENELLDKLREDKRELQSTQREIKNNQNQRLQNIGEVASQVTRENKVISEDEAAKIARDQDLSSKGGSIAVFGKEIVETKGAAAEAGIVADALLSKRSGEVLGASVDQFIGSNKGDKTVEQVAEKNAILASQRAEDGFNPVQEGSDVIGSIPGIVATSVAGGAAFSAGSKAVGSIPRVGSQAQKLFQAGGVALGGTALASQAGKASEQVSKGREAEAAGTVINTGAGFTGFLKGGRAFNSKFGTKTGTTTVNQKNLLRSTDKSEFTGFGRFKAETNILNTKIRSPFSSDSGFQKPFKTVQDGKVVTTGRFGVSGSRSSSKGKGTFQVDTPKGTTEKGRFEFLSSVKDRGTTETGNKFTISSDTTRFKTESRLFRNFKDDKTVSKTIKQDQETVNPSQVLNKFESVPSISKNSQVKKTSLVTTNAQGNRFGNVENFILRAGGSTSTSGSGSTVTTGRGSTGGFKVSSNRFRGLAESKASSFADSQNPKGNTFTATSTSSSQNTQNSNQETTGNQADTFTSLQSEGLESFREREFTDNNIQTVKQENKDSQKEETVTVDNPTGVTTTESTNTLVDQTSQTTAPSTDLLDNPDTDSKTVQNQKTAPKNIQNTGNKGLQKQEDPLTEAKKIGRGFTGGISNRSATTTGNLTIPQLNQVQQNRNIFESAPETVNTTSDQGFTAQPGGFLMLNDVQGGNNGLSFDVSGPGTNQDMPDTLNTDWFSANLVEQETNQEAVFNLSTAPASNPLFGLKTTQEQKGNIRNRKTTDLDIQIL